MSRAASTRGLGKRTELLIDAARDILAEIQPCSVRAVCYQLFIRGLIPNMSKNSTGAVGRALVTARERGLIHWAWIVDESREAEAVAQWSSPAEIINSAVGQYRKDRWRDQAETVEVWSEKGTIRGALAPVLHEFGVTFRVMHGYTSATVVNDIASTYCDDQRPLRALYLGDWDPSGLHMSEVDLPERLARYGGAVDLQRIALDESDAANLSLPEFAADTKLGDSRHAWFTRRYGQRCIEIDALSPVVMRERLRNAILAHVDGDAWDHAGRIEAAERDSMSSILGTWQASLGGGA